MAELLSKVNFLEVVLKVTEQCNINCTYCYMFNKGNDDFSFRPPILSEIKTREIIDFLKQGISELQVARLDIIFHGGEPLMMGKRRFSKMCHDLETALTPLVECSLAVQTNAILVDDEWIDIFSAHNISVGVSLDGPPEVHDRYRLDNSGAGTYEATLAGIECLRRAYNDGRIKKPGAICVIDPKTDARKTYRHFINLGFDLLSFNLPMETVETVPLDFEVACSKYLEDLFDEWKSDERTDISIRMFDLILRYLSGDADLIKTIPNVMRQHLMVVVASDGELSEHDDFKVINFAQRCGNVRDTTLKEFANSDLRYFLHDIANSIPSDCRNCDWRNFCRAGVTFGLTVSRYSEANGFNNRSSTCAAFSSLAERASAFLIKNGLPVERIEEALAIGPYAEDCITSPPNIPENLLPKKLSDIDGAKQRRPRHVHRQISKNKNLHPV